MKASKIIIAIVACVALGAIIYFLAGKNEQQVKPPESPPVVTEQKEPGLPDEQKKPDEEKEAEPAATNAETGEIDKKLREILLSASEYYSDTINTTIIITQNGRLHNAAAGITVTPEYLMEREYLSRDYMIDGATVLYIFPDDLAAVSPEYERIYSPSDKLAVFVAVPFDNGYMIDAKGIGERIKISSEDFGKLLSTYRIDYGETRRVTGSTDDYPEIIKAIMDFRGVNSEFYVRYGMRNDKYAVMIISPKESYETINEYVLEEENGVWNVKVANLEAVSKGRMIANNVCPGLDNALMPKYDIKDYSGNMLKDFTGITEALVNDGYIVDENPVIKYVSATDKLLFAVYENGRMFVGVNNDNLWILGEVPSVEDAYEHFRLIEDRPPDFILIWE